MAFQRRVDQSVALTDLLDEVYWADPSIRDGQGFTHTPFGYETHLPPEVRDRLVQAGDLTALAVRLEPDYLVTKEFGSLKLEYKTTTTPRYTAGDQQWNVGQIEADPWEYYLHLRREGQRVALFIYCSFHPRPLLCDFPEADWALSGRQRVWATQKGSATDYYNLDLTKLRTFSQFMAEEFGVPMETSDPLLLTVLGHVIAEPRLQTRHDRNSPFHGNADYETGFNWDIP